MHITDIAVIAVYLAGVIWAGIRSRGRRDDADEYFTAKGGFRGVIGSVAVGLSMAATLFSGISFVVYSSVAYGSGARIMLCSVGLVICWIVLRFWFLPRFLPAAGNHPYDIVERRLGPAVRLCVSAMFILLRVGWMAVMLVAPTVVVLGAGGLGPSWFWPVLLATGLSCTVYSAIGGIRGVIVTDAIQFAVMALGIIFIIGFVLARLGIPPGDIWRQLEASGRLHLFDRSFSWTQTISTWSVLIGMTFGNMASYVADLMMLQRYMAADSPRSAARSFAVNIAGAIGVIFSLVVVGLLLWVWYRQNPDPALPASTDQVLPYFIAHELPAGLSGLLIASILAATMSSMTSGILALAGTLTNDWVKRFGRPRSQAELFVFGRRASIAVGLLSTAAAGLVNRLGTLFQVSQTVLGAFLGPMLACMILVVSGRPFRPGVVLAGMIAGVLTGWAVASTPASVVWIPAASSLVAIIIPLIGGRRNIRADGSAIEPDAKRAENIAIPSSASSP